MPQRPSGKRQAFLLEQHEEDFPTADALLAGISNYMVFKGLRTYNYNTEARQLAEKTITLFGRDFETNGALHEYYEPETGEPILKKGFQNWNYLVMNMMAWLEGRTVVEEF